MDRKKLTLVLIAALVFVSVSAYGVQRYRSIDTISLAAPAYQAAPAGGPGTPGCACCNKKDAPGGTDPASSVKKIAADYYAARSGDREVTVDVKDFGCHMEAYVIKSGRTVLKLSFQNGQVQEIS